MSDDTFSGYEQRTDLATLVALAEGGEPKEEPAYIFGGGRRKFYESGPPWYAELHEQEPMDD